MTTTIHKENLRNSNNSGMADYDEEARKLLARVHLDAQEDDDCDNNKANAKSTIIYRDPRTGGTIHVGNAVAARSKNWLDSMAGPSPCRRIVCCQGSSKFSVFRNDPEFEYFHFPIAQWKQDMGGYNGDDHDDDCGDDPSDFQAVDYFHPLFEFLDLEMESGNAVLIHCFSGAQLSGTCGIAALMYLTGMNSKEATRIAQTLRPTIDPISELLVLLEGELQS